MHVLEDTPRRGYDHGNRMIIQTRDADMRTDSYGAPG